MAQIQEELQREFFKRALYSTALFFALVGLLALPVAANPLGVLALVIFAGVFAIAIPYALYKRKRLQLAASLFVAAISAPALVTFWYGRSLFNGACILEFGVVVLSAMVLKRNRAVWVAAGFLLFDLAKMVLQSNGFYIPLYFPGNALINLVIFAFTMVWIAPVLFLANDSLHRTMSKLQEQVAELHVANIRLLTSERLRQSITETAPVGILVFDADGRNVFANSFAVARLGDEVRWSHLDRLPWPVTDMSGEPIPIEQQPFRQVATSQRAIYSTNLAIERPPGRRIHLSVSVAPLGPNDQSIVVAFEDISSRLEMERRHVHAQRLASMGQLAGSVAHDFNNFLTVIRGDSQLALNSAPPDSPLRTRLERIYSSSNNAAAVCRQLLAFARRDEAPPQPFSVNSTIEESGATLRSLLPPTVELTFDLAPDTPLIMGEPILLLQALMNLTVNARDAMRDGGKFSIQTMALDHGLMLIVEDTGAGMDDATLASLFDPYFTTKPAGHGTGLGMAIVYGVVQQFGGWIRVESELGKGTRFLIRLPAAAVAVTQDL